MNLLTRSLNKHSVSNYLITSILTQKATEGKSLVSLCGSPHPPALLHSNVIRQQWPLWSPWVLAIAQPLHNHCSHLAADKARFLPAIEQQGDLFASALRIAL
jgi:hypothetical protein